LGSPLAPLPSVHRAQSTQSLREDLEAIDHSISSRLSRLETSMIALVAGVEAANAAAARRDETIRQLEAELVASRPSGGRPPLVRQDLDALTACIGDTLQHLDEIAIRLDSTLNGPASDA